MCQQIGLLMLCARCKQELQAKNAQLLAVTRQLGQDAERDKAQVRASASQLVAHDLKPLGHHPQQVWWRLVNSSAT
jgi:hypothetical protein